MEPAGTCAGRILEGAKPAEVPVQQPAEREPVVDLETTRALGAAVPRSVLPGANELIE